ncbi:MAG TPA: TRAP transporter small permease subunit [Syntrophales bacterium]|nr:TRAP transporter small permease subunit [Syntrophales bacterium]HPQ43638.1 TRAP transporter small permease subunit [Syntrophales bacterium]
MLKKIVSGINALNRWTGETAMWLFIPFTLLVAIDVFQRRVLHHPWYYIDITVQLMSALVVLGAGYCMLYDGHIGMDIIVSRFSEKTQRIIKIILFFFFLACLGPLLWGVTIDTWNAVLTKEAQTTSMGLPIYPLKILIFLGVLLFLLQGIAKFIEDILFLMGKSGGEE